MYRCLTLGGIAPPGAITVISSLRETTTLVNVTTLNFNKNNPNDQVISALDLQSHLLRLATDVSTDLSPAMGSKPADNSSYTLQFFGPTLSCNPPNSTDQELLDYFSQAYANDSGIINLEQYYHANGTDPKGFVVYSAFSPLLWAYETNSTGSSGYNWYPGGPFPNYCPGISGNSCYLTNISLTPVKFWIYLADDYLICSSSNASFEISVEYVNGQLSIQRNVEVVHDWSLDPSSEGLWYFYYYQALGSVIYGNVSIEVEADEPAGFSELVANYDLVATQSLVLTTGLVGCREFLGTPWFNLSLTFATSPWWQLLVNTTWQSSRYAPVVTGKPAPYNFGANSSTCRNNTLARALEDLAANMTISMLSYPDFT
jgi:hypothetical protein